MQRYLIAVGPLATDDFTHALACRFGRIWTALYRWQDAVASASVVRQLERLSGTDLILTPITDGLALELLRAHRGDD